MTPDLGKAWGVARAIWKGSLNFGLVNVPVGVFTATQDKTIHFNQFEAGTSDRIRYRKVNERTGKEVDNADIVRGFDLGGGEYVILSDEELESAEPERSRLIEITDFVDLNEIDPVYFRSTYYLAPEGEAAEKAYALLREVMSATHKVAIGTMVMRNKEYPVAIRPGDDVLKLETMYFSDEIRSPKKELPQMPENVDLSDRELSMAQLLLESMASDWDPRKYHDTHREKVEALIEEKRQGHEIVTAVQETPKATPVVDLMEVLSQSINSARAARGESTRGEPSASSSPTPIKKSGKRPPAAKKAAKSPAAKAPAKKATSRRKAS
jgi:DNA end-binding protein Ku